MKFSTCFTLIIVTALICMACIACTYLRYAALVEITPTRITLALPDTGGEPERAEAWNPRSKGGL